MLVDKFDLRYPFFEVRVGPPGATEDQLVLLPPNLHRLIEVFEYTEVVDGGQDSASRLRIVMLEDQHRPGSALDLVLDKKGNIRFLTTDQVQSGLARQKEIDALAEEQATTEEELRSNPLKQDIQKRLISLGQEKAEDTPTFIFQERNTIQVRWGYKSRRNSINALNDRVARGEIIQIRHRAPEGDIASTEIEAIDQGAGEFHKIVPREGKTFKVGDAKRILGSNALGVTGRSDEAPARVDDIIRMIAKDVLKDTVADVRLTKRELDLDIQQETSIRSWTMGQSLHEFLLSLAEGINAHYFVSHRQEQTVIHFVSRKLYESKGAFHFLWKSGIGASGAQNFNTDSLIFNTIKSYTMSVYPQGGKGATSTGVCSEQKQKVGALAENSVIFSDRFGAGPISIEQNTEDAQSLRSADVDNYRKNDATGLAEYKETCSRDNHVAAADALAGRVERQLKFTMNTIGIPQLAPSVIRVSNIGNRYSGLYYLLSVKHRITPSGGYTCSCVGESNSVATGGVATKPSQVRMDLLNRSTIHFVGSGNLDFDESDPAGPGLKTGDE